MFRGFQRLRVLTQMTLVGVLSVALLCVFAGYGLSRVSEGARENLTQYADSLSAQVEQNTETHYTTYAKILRMISFDKDVQSFLLCADDSERVTLHSALKRALIEVATLSASITDIVVEDASGQCYNLSDSLLPLPSMTFGDDGFSVSPLMTYETINRVQHYLVMGKNIASIDSYNQTNLTIGRVYLILTTDAFTGDARGNDAGSVTLYLLDQNGQVVWSDPADASQSALRRAQASPESFFYYATRSGLRPGYQLVALQETSGDLLSAGSSQADVLWAMLVLLMLLMLLWVSWARNLVRPLTRLRRFISRVQSGSREGLAERVTLHGYHEAEVISSEFNTLLHRIADLTDELLRSNTNLYESRLLAKQSELAHLRSQINPHFLYNTLETMVGIAYTKGQPELAEIARSLSLIFKFSIKGGSIVPLKTEWKIAQNYINIQHYRFSDRFDVQFDLPPECEELRVPKLILQPLIENAVVHGIEQMEGLCHLQVKAERTGDDLKLTVADNGAGMAPEALIRLNAQLRNADRVLSPEQEAHHIGILNVDGRIKLQYGASYGVSLESGLGRGTTVTLLLPAQKEEEHVPTDDRG